MPYYFGYWRWEDAFKTYGFGDCKEGGSWNGTDLVAEFIETLGYTTKCGRLGTHNYMIMDIQKDGVSLMDEKKISIGHDDPYDYLPADLYWALSEEFPGGHSNEMLEAFRLLRRKKWIHQSKHKHWRMADKSHEENDQ